MFGLLNTNKISIKINVKYLEFRYEPRLFALSCQNYHQIPRTQIQNAQPLPLWQVLPKHQEGQFVNPDYYCPYIIFPSMHPLIFQ